MRDDFERDPADIGLEVAIEPDREADHSIRTESRVSFRGESTYATLE